MTPEQQRYSDVTFIVCSKQYHSTAGEGLFHTCFKIWVVHMVEDPIDYCDCDM